jgi:hypothetical protein
MVEYQQALNMVRDILNKFPEVKQLIKLELNSQGSQEYVEYYQKPKNAEPQNHGTVSNFGTESTGDLPLEVGSGNVPTGEPDQSGNSGSTSSPWPWPTSTA